MTTNNEYTRHIKSKCFNGGSSNNKGTWGCPCCNRLRLGGANNQKPMLRREAKAAAKAELRKIIQKIRVSGLD